MMSIKLEDLSPGIYWKQGEDYKVVSLKNTTKFKVGKVISNEEVTTLCKDPKYNITIV
jgi:hypothetical protein